jgi:hypothetical protein
METEALIRTSHGAITFNKATGALQLTVPQGTKLVDAIRALAATDLSALAKLPRGCAPCLSGHPFGIEEQFDPVINVKLGQPG